MDFLENPLLGMRANSGLAEEAKKNTVNAEL